MTSRYLAPVAAVLALLLCAGAAAAAPWEVDPDSEVSFDATITLGDFVARSKALTGSVDYDEAGAALKQGVVVVAAGSFETGISRRDQHMRERYLEVSKYPTVELHLDPSSVPLGSGEKGTLKGRFKVHGVERPAALTVQARRLPDGRLEASCAFEVDITEFGIPQPRFAVVKMEPVIKVRVRLVLRPKR